MASLQQRLISTLAKMLMNGVSNFVTNQPSNLPQFNYLNTVFAQPMQQSKEWPDNRNFLIHTL